MKDRDKWGSNNQRFATQEEAQEAGFELEIADGSESGGSGHCGAAGICLGIGGSGGLGGGSRSEDHRRDDRYYENDEMLC